MNDQIQAFKTHRLQLLEVGTWASQIVWCYFSLPKLSYLMRSFFKCILWIPLALFAHYVWQFFKSSSIHWGELVVLRYYMSINHPWRLNFLHLFDLTDYSAEMKTLYQWINFLPHNFSTTKLYSSYRLLLFEMSQLHQ